MNENNFALTGDEARLLMAALAQSPVSVPSGAAIQLYVRLSEISQVQPPKQKS
jgi:hypothetical protein